MKMHSRTILCLVALVISFVAGAQTLKPVKDKVSKKYGYQDNSKNWVIAPAYDDARKFDEYGCGLVKVNSLYGLVGRSGEWILEPLYNDIGKFDKHGLCELMVKEGKVKYHGVANRFGQVLLPVEFHSVKIPKNGEYIAACREADQPGLEGEPLWGLYSTQGEEIFSPRFRSAPSYNNGTLVATDGKTGLEGVVDLESHVLLPFDFMAVTHFGNEYRTLDKRFRRTVFSGDFRAMESSYIPGSVIPYDVMEDPVRAAAWHCGLVGTRLHANQVRLIDNKSGLSVSHHIHCAKLDIDWGRGGNRFLRLEPFPAREDDPDAMEDPLSRKRYTLKALLYEADGTLVEEIADKGWLEGECHAGVLYSAAGQETWLVLADPNSLALNSYSINLTGYRPLDHDNVLNGMGIRSGDLMRLGNVRNFATRNIDILEGENVGVTSYTEPAVDLRYARKVREVAHADLFHQTFRMGDVVSCTVRPRSEEVEVDLYEQLVCRFNDHLQDPSYSMSGDEVIYWGPHNERFVRVSLEHSFDGMEDDVAGTGSKWSFVLSLFEEDGSWLRTLAVIPYADYVQDGMVVFRNAGIALVTPSARRRSREVFGWESNYSDRRGSVVQTIKLPGAQPAPRKLSALSAFRFR